MEKKIVIIKRLKKKISLQKVKNDIIHLDLKLIESDHS